MSVNTVKQSLLRRINYDQLSRDPAHFSRGRCRKFGMTKIDNDEIYSQIRDDAYRIGIGNTPLLQIQYGSRSIYAKLEYFNRFKSVKDRAAFFMIKKAIYDSRLNDRKIVIEGTSGNTGIAIANIADILGIRAELIIPPGTNEGTKNELGKTRATIIETESGENPKSTDLAILLSKEKEREFPERFVRLGQHENESNMLSHVYTTGPEILKSMGKIPEILAVGVGTGGTLFGLAKYFRSKNPKTRVFGIQPEKNNYIQGIRYLRTANEKEIIENNMDLIDEWIYVTEEMAYEQVKYVLRENGAFIGTSAGANLAGAKTVADRTSSGDILTVFPDSAEKYRSLYLEKGIFTEKEFDNLADRYRLVPENCI